MRDPANFKQAIHFRIDTRHETLPDESFMLTLARALKKAGFTGRWFEATDHELYYALCRLNGTADAPPRVEDKEPPKPRRRHYVKVKCEVCGKTTTYAKGRSRRTCSNGCLQAIRARNLRKAVGA